jgi:hypothetical protein
MDVRTNRRPDRGLAVCAGPIEGVFWKFLIGWSMNLPLR